jgi:hypothetical protein
MRRGIATVAFVTMMLLPGCRMRYEVKQPQAAKKITQVQTNIFQNKIPLNHELLLPKSLKEKIYNASTSKKQWRSNGRIQKINKVFQLRSGDELSSLKRDGTK